MKNTKKYYQSTEFNPDGGVKKGHVKLLNAN